MVYARCLSWLTHRTLIPPVPAPRPFQRCGGHFGCPSPASLALGRRLQQGGTRQRERRGIYNVEGFGNPSRSPNPSSSSTIQKTATPRQAAPLSQGHRQPSIIGKARPGGSSYRPPVGGLCLAAWAITWRATAFRTERASEGRPRRRSDWTTNSSPRVRATAYCFRHGEAGVSRVPGETLAARPLHNSRCCEWRRPQCSRMQELASWTLGHAASLASKSCNTFTRASTYSPRWSQSSVVGSVVAKGGLRANTAAVSAWPTLLNPS